MTTTDDTVQEKINQAEEKNKSIKNVNQNHASHKNLITKQNHKENKDIKHKYTLYCVVSISP